MTYTICVKDHLDPSWSDWLGGVEIVHLEDGTSLLRGDFPDQAALIGGLTQLNNLGVTVLSVKRELQNESESQSNAAEQ